MIKLKLYIIFKSFGKNSNALDLLKEKCEIVINQTGKRPNKEKLKKLAKDILKFLSKKRIIGWELFRPAF